MRLLFGTGNPAKLEYMKSGLAGLPIELIDLKEAEALTGKSTPRIPETGKDPLENARQKATAYYETFEMPVFSCDSGLYLEKVPEELQPGIHVRRIGDKTLSDEEMQAYYADLAKTYGWLQASYQNAICLVMDREHVYERMDESLRCEPFLITDDLRPIRDEGFPLDSISHDIASGKHYYDAEDEVMEETVTKDGFYDFFEKILLNEE